MTADGAAAERRAAPKATFHVLLYGQYVDLARRCIESIRRFVPRDEYLLRIGMNACCAETRRYVESLSEDMPIDLVVRSDVNLYQFPMMRKMFWDKPIATDWIVWFDDDTHILSDVWWPGVWQRLREDPAEALGQLLWWVYLPGEWKFIQTRPWFQGRAPQRGLRIDSPAARFMTGSYWMIKTACIRELDWPDPELVAQGGDTLLGAAMWQKDWRQIHFVGGIKVNDAPRRGVTMPRIGVESKKKKEPADVGDEAEANEAERVRSPAELRRTLPDWAVLFAERRQLEALDSRMEEKTDWLLQQLGDTVSLLRGLLLERAVRENAAKDESEAEAKDTEAEKLRIQREWLKNPAWRRGLALCLNEDPDGRNVATALSEGEGCKDRVGRCRAVCCKMLRALSEEEVEEGRLRWSTQSPFLLPRDEDGYCAYLDRETFECTVHENRPAACRSYSCERDRQVWEDYWAAIPGPLLC